MIQEVRSLNNCLRSGHQPQFQKIMVLAAHFLVTVPVVSIMTVKGDSGDDNSEAFQTSRNWTRFA